MHCHYCNKSYEIIIIEGDFGADPLWCGHCHANLELDELPLSTALQAELTTWMCDFGEWIDIENDAFLPGLEHLAEKHDKQGALLAQKVAGELGSGIAITFRPYLSY